MNDVIFELSYKLYDVHITCQDTAYLHKETTHIIIQFRNDNCLLIVKLEKNRSIWNSPEFSIILCLVMSTQNRIVDKKGYREL